MYHTFLYTWNSDKLAFPLNWKTFSNGEEEPVVPPPPEASLWDREGSAGPSDLFHAKKSGEVKIALIGSDLPSDYAVVTEGYIPRNYGLCYEVHDSQLWYTTRDSWQNVTVCCYWTRDTNSPAQTWQQYYRNFSNRFPIYWKMRENILGRKYDDVSYRELIGKIKQEAEAHGFWSGGATYQSGTRVYKADVVQYIVPEAKLPAFSFRYNEYDAYIGWRDLRLLPNLYRNGFACAFTEAAKRLPFAATNSLANFVEIAVAIVNIAQGLKAVVRAPRYAAAWSQKLGLAEKGVSLGVSDFKNPFHLQFKKPKDLWLAYRYSYTTTKADIEEYSVLLKRLQQLPSQQHVRVGGSFRRDDLYFRATAEFVVEDVLPENVWNMVGTFNAELSARNAWDLIPFSFVVDWFLKIGDELERYDLFNMAQAIRPSKVWYSCHSSYPDPEGNPQDIYVRINGAGVKLGNPVWSEQKSSLRTKLFRVVDGLALFGAGHTT
jgi:hypothetical protein